MRYKDETLAKYEAMAREMIAFYRDEIRAGRIPRMRLSSGNSKIGRVRNFSTLAILTCGNCDECKHFCYAVKDAIRFPENVMRARAINTALLWYAPDELLRQFREYFGNPRRRNRNFRFDVSGEINTRLLEMIVTVARENPTYTVWMYTKMYHIVNRYVDRVRGSLQGLEARRAAIPSNLSIMFSKWDGVPMENPYLFPVFAVRMAAGNREPMEWNKMFRCPGDCQKCLRNHRGCIAGEDTYNDEH